MPTYTYKCESCGNKFDARRKIAERQDNLECPECGEAAVYTPEFKTQPPVFTGSGFYETDYKRKE